MRNQQLRQQRVCSIKGGNPSCVNVGAPGKLEGVTHVMAGVGTRGDACTHHVHVMPRSAARRCNRKDCKNDEYKQKPYLVGIERQLPRVYDAGGAQIAPVAREKAVGLPAALPDMAEVAVPR